MTDQPKQRGDMSFVRGNLAIRDHEKNGKDLYLFEQAGRGLVRYVGQICAGHHQQTGPDADGHQRKVIVFELLPSEYLTETADSAEQDAKLINDDQF